MAYNNNNKNKKKPNRKGHKSSYQSNAPKKEEAVKEITYSDAITVGQLAQLLHKNSSEIIKFLFMMGNMSTINTVLSDEDIELICMNFNVEVHKEVVVDEDDIEEQLQNVEEDESKLVPRPPVVTIMGHVDHGKTTLLDTIRKANVTENEFGGITQHIGAYQVSLKGRKVTFLDTPGHEAFTAMRARGAEVTDIVIIVVAADDGVMPQTKEAVDHAKAAGVPIVVAVNKIDKPGANPDRIMSEMSELGIMPEEWGGDTIFTQVSAKKGTGVPELLETMLLVADMQELKANPDTNASGTVIEAKLDKGRGPVATLLVQRGTLHTGDSVVVGTSYGRVRKMTNDRGMEIKHAEPSCPVEIIGLNEVPRAGDVFMSYDSYKKYSHVNQQVPHNLLKVGVINSWGELRRWGTHLVHHAIWYKQIYSYTGVMEALSGFPFDVRFISFDDIRKDPSILEDMDVVMNIGSAYTSFSGGAEFDETIITALRRYVDQGGGFIGVGEPTAINRNGKYFTLYDVLGVDKELGFTMHTDKYNWEVHPNHFITEQLEHEDWGECINNVYALPGTEILAEKDLHVNLAVNEYGKGRGVYMNGLPFSFENVRLLYRAIFFAAHKEDEMKHWYSENYNVDVNVYPSTNSFCVVNNTYEPQTTTIYKGDGSSFEVELAECEIQWFEI